MGVWAKRCVGKSLHAYGQANLMELCPRQNRQT